MNYFRQPERAQKRAIGNIPPDMEKNMKTVTLYTPTSIQSALNGFDRYFESFFGDNSNPLGFVFNHAPAADIRETENSYLLEMELPGCDEKNIDIHVDGSNLTIASKQETKSDEKRENFLLRERKLSAFSRSFKLPENADPEVVSAALKNGVLSLNIMKRAEAQKKTIQINAA